MTKQGIMQFNVSTIRIQQTAFPTAQNEDAGIWKICLAALRLSR